MNFSPVVTAALKVIGLLSLLSSGACVPLARDDGGLATSSPQPLVHRSADRASAVAPVVRSAAPAGWKAVLVGGSHQIDGYNNAATDLAQRLRRSGVERVAVLHSAGPQASDAMPAARRRDIRQALGAFGAGEACLFFITSHGNDRGIYLSTERGYLSPRELSNMVDAECGKRPTVLIVSGCHTGTFITSALTASNRIILTASERGRVSYGASTSDRYVNFDRCLIKAMDEGARTWREMFDRALPCVSQRESALGVTASQPQAWFGTQVANLALPGR